MSKPAVTVTILLCFILLLAGCSQSPVVSESAIQPSESPSESAIPDETPLAELEDLTTTYPVTVTDLTGEEVTIESADKIVSLTPSNTEILIAENAQGRIIAIDASSTDLMPDAQVVGDYTGPDVETIVALEPDVILAGNNIQYDAIERMRSLNLPVVVSEATSWDQVDQSFELIGRIINENDNAAKLTQQLQSTIEDVEALAPAAQLTCYYMMSYGEAGNWTSGKGSFVNDMMQFCGGKPVTADIDSPWVEYPLEDLTLADPDCILMSTEAGEYEDLLSAPGYESLSAVKNGMVFSIDSDLVTRPGPGLSEGLLAISGILNAAAEGPVAPPSASAS